MQRLLSARNLAQSRAALMASWAVILFQFSLFLLIGIALFVYYREAQLPAPAQTERIYPRFVWENLPPGVAGLVIAAIVAAAMANLSAALNSLASTTVMDFLRPMVRARVGRLTTPATSAGHDGRRWPGPQVLLAIGIVARHWGSVLESGLSIASVITSAFCWAYFCWGVLTRIRPGTERGFIWRRRGSGHDSLCPLVYAYRLDLVGFNWEPQYLRRRISCIMV